MAKLTVKRKKQLQSGLVPLAIAVDGEDQKGLRSGGRVELDLPPGQHQVDVGNSRALQFDNSSGDDTEIVVWISTWSSKAKARLVD